MKKVSILVLVLLTGCSYSVNVIHTQGKAKDLVDEVQTTSPEIKPDLTLPLI